MIRKRKSSKRYSKDFRNKSGTKKTNQPHVASRGGLRR